MIIECENCHEEFEMNDADVGGDVECPNCGSCYFCLKGFENSEPARVPLPQHRLSRQKRKELKTKKGKRQFRLKLISFGGLFVLAFCAMLGAVIWDREPIQPPHKEIVVLEHLPPKIFELPPSPKTPELQQESTLPAQTIVVPSEKPAVVMEKKPAENQQSEIQEDPLPSAKPEEPAVEIEEASCKQAELVAQLENCLVLVKSEGRTCGVGFVGKQNDRVHLYLNEYVFSPGGKFSFHFQNGRIFALKPSDTISVAQDQPIVRIVVPKYFPAVDLSNAAWRTPQKFANQKIVYQKRILEVLPNRVLNLDWKGVKWNFYAQMNEKVVEFEKYTQWVEKIGMNLKRIISQADFDVRYLAELRNSYAESLYLCYENEYAETQQYYQQVKRDEPRSYRFAELQRILDKLDKKRSEAHAQASVIVLKEIKTRTESCLETLPSTGLCLRAEKIINSIKDQLSKIYFTYHIFW